MTISPSIMWSEWLIEDAKSPLETILGGHKRVSLCLAWANVIIGGDSEYTIFASLIASFACSKDSAIIAKITCPL